MYINFKILEKEGFSPFHLVLLLAVKQKEFDYLEAVCHDYIEELLENGFIKTIKVSKKLENSMQVLRITPKGNKILNELETAEVEEEDKKVFDWLKSHYKKIDKEVGNGAKTLRHIRDFRVKSGIEKNNLIKLCLAFLQDEDNMQYNNKLEFAFYKPATAFETRFNLEESRLYKYYLKREDYFKSIFEDYETA
jgi:subtilisin-like proprotein convertase family protein